MITIQRLELLRTTMKNHGAVSISEMHHVFDLALEAIQMKTTLAESERIIHLIEECSEVIQAACKVQRFGFDGNYDNGEKNRQKLTREMGDVRGAMIIMTNANDVSKEMIHKQADHKMDKFAENSFFQEIKK